MQQQEHTAKYFRESYPKWKRRKDSLLVRFIYRPISFYTASIATKIGLSANDISFLSTLVAIIGALMYFFKSQYLYIVGSILINIWMILDCTDGNIARSIRKEPFGEFADASSSYILINFLFSFLGVAAYQSNGFFINKGCWWILFLGVFTGSCDSLGRLLYQKFINTQLTEQSDQDQMEDSCKTEKQQKKLLKFHDRIDKEIGLNGIFLPALVIVSILGWFDIFVTCYAVFYIGSLVANYIYLLYKCYESKKHAEKMDS